MASRDINHFISIDVETNGHTPGINSMISLGASAYDKRGNLIKVFWQNLQTLEKGIEDLETMSFWNRKTNRDAYKIVTSNPRSPELVMKDFKKFIDSLNKVHFIGYNIPYDLKFVEYYANIYAPFKDRWIFGTDIRGVMVGMGYKFSQTTKRKWDKKLTEGFKYDPMQYGPTLKDYAHTPLYDAQIQGYAFFKSLKMRK